MLRHLLRAPLWRNQTLPSVGVELDPLHTRARGLLGLWVPHATGLRGSIPYGDHAEMRDLSTHRRTAVFDFGVIANQTNGEWVTTRDGVGFHLIDGQHGRFDVVPTRTTDWDFPGAFTLMCRVRLDVLTTADASNRVFAGRSDGAGGGSKKWWWAWTSGGYSTVPAKRLMLFNIPLPTGEDPRASVDWDPVLGETYTVALTRGIDKTLRFYIDGYQIGDDVASALPMSIPDVLDLSWGYGEDFGSNLAGTFFWMKVWERDLSPHEVFAEHVSPWEMLRLPIHIGGAWAGGTRAWTFCDDAMLMGAT